MIFTSTNLLVLWLICGVICCAPLVMNKTWLKYAAVLLVFGSVYVTFLTTDQWIGRAKYIDKQEDFIFKSYSVSSIKGRKWITMWISDKHDDLLVRIPYEKKLEEKLRKAQKRKRKGIAQKGRYSNSRRRANPTQDQSAHLDLYDFPFQKVFPKNKMGKEKNEWDRIEDAIKFHEKVLKP